MLRIYPLWWGLFICLSIDTRVQGTDLTIGNKSWDVAHEEYPGRGSNWGSSAELTNVELADAMTIVNNHDN